MMIYLWAQPKMRLLIQQTFDSSGFYINCMHCIVLTMELFTVQFILVMVTERVHAVGTRT